VDTGAINFPDIQEAVAKGRVTWRLHAIERMFERNISRQDVRMAVHQGEIIESYPSSYLYPACLLFGKCTQGPLHVVIAWDSSKEWVYIITAYMPDEDHFTDDFRIRKRG